MSAKQRTEPAYATIDFSKFNARVDLYRSMRRDGLSHEETLNRMDIAPTSLFGRYIKYDPATASPIIDDATTLAGRGGCGNPSASVQTTTPTEETP